MLKNEFLVCISEREDLNKRIRCNEKFDFKKIVFLNIKNYLKLFWENYKNWQI
uniref:Uncharacterized protein n=1 Tax=Borrelia garinii subsp. bavariensis (strain ATCC BAA-2496 / DSM 23469 / PBi) TaxID=290434 RepID=A0A7M4BKV0_BORGP|nr:hypothetical protein BGP139 [Borreliella bavariensis PBi]